MKREHTAEQVCELSRLAREATVDYPDAANFLGHLAQMADKLEQDRDTISAQHTRLRETLIKARSALLEHGDMRSVAPDIEEIDAALAGSGV